MRKGNGGIIGPRKVTTTSTGGSGVWSVQEAQIAQGAAVWPSNKPDAPIIGVATSTGTTTATVAFTAPVYTGASVIISYTAVSSPDGITASLSQSGSGTISISGLTTGTTYTFTVYATNSDGSSAFSAASNSIVPQVQATNVDMYLIAGGGGAGGGYNSSPGTFMGGGGGAGGVVYVPAYPTNYNTAIPISIGGGGSGVSGAVGPSGAGTGTTFTGTSSFSAFGGGYGGYIQFSSFAAPGGPGGSGGGAAEVSPTPTTGNSGPASQPSSSSFPNFIQYGNPGASAPPSFEFPTGFPGAYLNAGGGGGAGSAGGTPNPYSSRAIGGTGITIPFAPAPTQLVAGGGYGGGTEPWFPGSTSNPYGGGYGGGKGAPGAPPNAGNGNPGRTNSGGGGGGGGGPTGSGGNGGSGRLILQIPLTNTATFTPGLTVTQYSPGSKKVYDVTAGSGTVTFT
jgi:hypothetical protein